MRLTLLVLLLAVCVHAGVFSELGDKVKNLFGGEGNVRDKIKEGLKKIFNTTNVLKFREKLSKMKDKIKKTLQLSPQMIASLKERLARLRPIEHVHVHEAGDTIDEINENSKVGEYLFQSDIILTDQQFEEVEEDVEEETSGVNRTKRQAFRDRRYPRTIWPSGVNYYFDYSASEKVRSVFRKGAKEWEKDTCINMKEDSTANDKIRVFAENGCWSYVGRIGGKQDLSLGRGCESIGTAAHELGHALGLFHTMSRHDRDSYITLNSHNVKPDWLDQFTKQTPHTNENYGITYDYGSIMHYGGTRCLCPGGYSGRLCNERPSGCGEVLTAASDYKDLTKTIGYRNMRENEDFEKCIYWIEAPQGTRVEVKIDSISGSYAVDGCPYFGVEIKSQLDQKATGYRFCAREDAGVTLMSHSNRVPVIVYSREGLTDVRLKYRYVSNGKPVTEPKFTTTVPLTTTKAQPRRTTYGPRPTIIFTSKPLPGSEGGHGFEEIGGLGGLGGFGGLGDNFDKFFCRDMPSCDMLKMQGFGCSSLKSLCPKMCRLC
ncbi:astacin [Ancylostoma ceylanicum]|uniref:Metalloendopeptidase n=1 Tax=Ancylostoma ceylanicum TaxID=53326 RepID=A0A0D6MDA5_9BILA|nr:astacin [Ancylostoma ceylanicum]